MNWIDIACIVFVCVTANHLDMIKAVEEVCGHELPIINCVKCSSFWAVLFYTVAVTHEIIAPLAISFLSSYLAIWLELLEASVDRLYDWIYEQIYPTED